MSTTDTPGLLKAHPGAFGPTKIPPLKGITRSGTRMVCSVPEGGKPPARWRRDPDFPAPPRRSRSRKGGSKIGAAVTSPDLPPTEVKTDGATFWPSRSDDPEPFERGQQLVHSNRGPCVFRGLDDMTRNGETSWVEWPDGTGGMVTTRLLSPPTAPAGGGAVMAHDLRNNPGQFIGKSVTVTATSWGGRPGKVYTGELTWAEAVLPTGNKSYTGVWIKGVSGSIWLDNDSAVVIPPDN